MNTNELTPQSVIYMLRHYLTANIPDVLSKESRGYTEYTQYFISTGEDTQTIYLERKSIQNGKMDIIVGGIPLLKTDYSVNYDKMTINITKKLDKEQEIRIDYDSIKSWIYDDHPNLNAGDFPRITIDEVNTTFETFEVGEYYNYKNKKGNLVKGRFRIIVRHRQNINFYTYNGTKLKNYDVVNAITDNIVRFFKENKEPNLWLFRTFDVGSIQRVTTEEDSGILRKDIDLDVIYFHNGC